VTERKMPKTIILPRVPSDVDPATQEFLEQLSKVIDKFYRATARELSDHEDRLVAGGL